MTEVALDPAVAEGQTTEGAGEGSAEPINEVGMGMLELDDTQSDPDEQAGQTNANEVEAPSAQQRKTTNDDLSPLERDRREADRYFTQLRQQHDQYVAGEKARLQQLQQAAQQQPAPVQQQTVQDAESLRRAAMQAGDPEQQRSLMEQAAGIDYVQQMVTQQLTQFAQQHGLDKVSQLYSTVEQLQGQTQAQVQKEMKAQIADAVEVFGEDIAYDESTLRFIQRNRDALKEVNPKTGENWTLSELIGRWTGRSADEAREARQTQRTQRRSAKSGAATRGQSAGVRNQQAGVISKAAALDEIRDTF